jgi:SAM-dependent methyltransferase
VSDLREELARAERFVESCLPHEVVVKVFAMEAGTLFGVRSPAYVVGVETVQAEKSPRRDADEYRTVDLERVELESAEYDLVLCCNVLEHTRRPLATLPSFHQGLKAGGLMVIMVPNVVSLKGLVTRLTPHSVHRWYFRRIVGRSPDLAPAPGLHSLSLRPRSLRRHVSEGGWHIEYWRIYEGGMQKSLRYRLGVVGWRWRLVVVLTRVLSLGLVTAEGTGVIAVLSKAPD